MKKISLIIGSLLIASSSYAIPSGTEIANLCALPQECGASFTGIGDLIAPTNKTVSLQEATSASACMGTLTATGATPVVTSTTCATTGSRVFLSRTSAETGVVSAWQSALSNGVSFSVTGEAGDTGTYNWFIIHEAP